VTYVAKDWATWNEQHPYIPHPRQSAGDGPHQAQSAKWEPSEELKADILDYTEGYNSSPALDNAVREGPQTAPEISRGLMVQEGDFNTIVNGMKEGESVQLPPTSWSSDPAVAAEFASKESPSTAGYDELTHSITFNLDAGAKGIDIAPYAMEDFAYQKEWLVAGNYTVKSVEVSGTSAVIGLGVK
jgi:hypothetical protein